ncbi:TPA: dTMP kinase, partial [Candidatus Poribacteria bacterium]|nr:dTMP kinase [Candidatus Poribacteria bacterium]
MRGVFVTFEGTEGSGKTTQIQRLSADLAIQRYSVIVTREPGGTAISEQIRSLLLDPENTAMKSTTELLLYAASRTQHVLEKIIPALEEGKVAISDRFADASLAYQGYGRGLDINLIRSLNQVATNGIVPDITFLLDLPVDIGLKR